MGYTVILSILGQLLALVIGIKAFVKPKCRTIKAVDGLTFGINKGEILGFIGPNRSWKINYN